MSGDCDDGIEAANDAADFTNPKIMDAPAFIGLKGDDRKSALRGVLTEICAPQMLLNGWLADHCIDFMDAVAKWIETGERPGKGATVTALKPRGGPNNAA